MTGKCFVYRVPLRHRGRDDERRPARRRGLASHRVPRERTVHVERRARHGRRRIHVVSANDDFFILHSDVLKTPRVFARVRTESPIRTRDTRTTTDRVPRGFAGTRLTRRPRRRFGRLTLSSGSSFSTLAQRYARFPPFVLYITRPESRITPFIRPNHERYTLTARPARLLTSRYTAP